MMPGPCSFSRPGEKGSIFLPITVQPGLYVLSRNVNFLPDSTHCTRINLQYLRVEICIDSARASNLSSICFNQGFHSAVGRPPNVSPQPGVPDL